MVQFVAAAQFEKKAACSTYALTTEDDEAPITRKEWLRAFFEVAAILL